MCKIRINRIKEIKITPIKDNLLTNSVHLQKSVAEVKFLKYVGSCKYFLKKMSSKSKVNIFLRCQMLLLASIFLKECLLDQYKRFGECGQATAVYVSLFSSNVELLKEFS